MENLTAYKMVNIESLKSGDNTCYGIEYFGQWVLFGSLIDAEMFIETQYKIFPELIAAADIFDYMPSWDRADADIFTIAFDISKNIDYHIDYFENEYSDFKKANSPNYCRQIENILKKLQQLKAEKA